MKKIVILGAGLAGLSAAFHIEKEKNRLQDIDYEIFEREKKAGGLCRTEGKKGFLFDYSGHLLHLKSEYTKKLVQGLLKNNITCHKRDAWIYLKDRYIKYPFQANLDALPDDIRKECLEDFYKAEIKNRGKKNSDFKNFEDWIIGRFGRGIAEHFMLPYNKKLWINDLREISCSWVDEFIPVPQSKEITEAKKRGHKKEYGYNINFQYPESGGIQVLPDVFEKKIKKVRLDMEANKIDLDNKVLGFSNYEEIKYDILISTIPLKKLIRIAINPPKRIKNCAGSLQYNSVLIINLGIKRNDSSKHWVYVPEGKYPFYRFGYFSNFSESMAPEWKSSIYCEVSYRGEEKIDQEKTYRDSIDGLIDIGVIRDKSEIIVEKFLDIEYAYIIYNNKYENSIKEIHSFLKNHDVFSIGRYGAWEYSSMEDAILSGKRVAETILNNQNL